MKKIKEYFKKISKMKMELSKGQKDVRKIKNNEIIFKVFVYMLAIVAVLMLYYIWNNGSHDESDVKEIIQTTLIVLGLTFALLIASSQMQIRDFSQWRLNGSVEDAKCTIDAYIELRTCMCDYVMAILCSDILMLSIVIVIVYAFKEFGRYVIMLSLTSFIFSVGVLCLLAVSVCITVAIQKEQEYKAKGIIALDQYKESNKL